MDSVFAVAPITKHEDDMFMYRVKFAGEEEPHQGNVNVTILVDIPYSLRSQYLASLIRDQIHFEESGNQLVIKRNIPEDSSRRHALEAVAVSLNRAINKPKGRLYPRRY